MSKIIRKSRKSQRKMQVYCKNYNCTAPIPQTKNANNLCIKHGGGVRCKVQNCDTLAVFASQQLCKKHGGGINCSEFFCTTKRRRPGFCIEHKNKFCKVGKCKNILTYNEKRGRCLCQKHSYLRKKTVFDCINTLFVFSQKAIIHQN